MLMDLHAADALVTGYEHLIEDLELPDPDDRHVLAARDHRESLRNPPGTIGQYLDALETQGLRRAVSVLRGYMR
jgi:hypothetical protein